MVGNPKQFGFGVPVTGPSLTYSTIISGPNPRILYILSDFILVAAQKSARYNDSSKPMELVQLFEICQININHTSDNHLKLRAVSTLRGKGEYFDFQMESVKIRDILVKTIEELKSKSLK
jgi:hypothetical protein